MALPFPEIDPIRIQLTGPRKIAQLLANQLDSRIEIFTSLQCLGGDRKNEVVEGECDFVVLDALRGLLFLDVKGGTLTFDAESNRWRRALRGRASLVEVSDPFELLQRCMHQILNTIKSGVPERGRKLPFAYAHAIAFPDAKGIGELPLNIVPSQIFGMEKCVDIKNSVDELFLLFCHTENRQLSPLEVQAIYESLFLRYVLVSRPK